MSRDESYHSDLAGQYWSPYDEVITSLAKNIIVKDYFSWSVYFSCFSYPCCNGLHETRWHSMPKRSPNRWQSPSLLRIANAAEECENPSRDLPRAMIFALMTCAFLYVSWAALEGSGVASHGQPLLCCVSHWVPSFGGTFGGPTTWQKFHVKPLGGCGG